MSTTVAEEQKTVNLFSLGCLVNLKIRSWSGRKMLTRADMVKVGYDPDLLPKDIVNPGRKLMVPKAELQAINRIEQNARRILDRWSVPFGIANAHFVPAKMLPTVEAQIEDLKVEFFKLVDSFITRFHEMKEAVKNDYPDFWEKCLAQHYPNNPQALRRYFSFDMHIFKVTGFGTTEETDVEEAMAREKVMENRTRELKGQMQAEVGEFVTEYVTTMRNETIRFCELMTARVNGTPFGDENEGKQLTPRTIGYLKKYADKFRNMNIFGDSEIEKMLIDFKRDFLDGNSSPTDFESAHVKSAVTDALTAIHEKAAAEGESGSQFIGELTRRIVI